MPSHRTTWFIIAAIFAAVTAFLLRPATQKATGELLLQKTNLTGDAPISAPRASPFRPPPPPPSGTSPELELNRLEGQFYHQFPLALKYRDYKSPQKEALAEKFKVYMQEPADIPTRNLRTGNLNIILQMEMAILFKLSLATDSEPGEMLRASWKSPRWDWNRMVRNLDDRLGSAPVTPPEVLTGEQLVAEIGAREERIIEYCQKKQVEAEMPDAIREDVRHAALELVTHGIASAHLEAITPLDLKEARKRVASEARLNKNP